MQCAMHWHFFLSGLQCSACHSLTSGCMPHLAPFDRWAHGGWTSDASHLLSCVQQEQQGTPLNGEALERDVRITDGGWRQQRMLERMSSDANSFRGPDATAEHAGSREVGRQDAGSLSGGDSSRYAFGDQVDKFEQDPAIGMRLTPILSTSSVQFTAVADCITPACLNKHWVTPAWGMCHIMHAATGPSRF